MESHMEFSIGKRTIRNAELSSGCRKPQEAKAGSRKAQGTHNLPDRAIPKVKTC